MGSPSKDCTERVVSLPDSVKSEIESFAPLPHLMMLFLSRATQPMSHRVGWSVGLSVGPSHFVSRFAFSAILSYLKVEKFRYECFMDVHATAQIITAPAQLITAPAQPPATGVVVYTALFTLIGQVSS